MGLFECRYWTEWSVRWVLDQATFVDGVLEAFQEHYAPVRSITRRSNVGW